MMELPDMDDLRKRCYTYSTSHETFSKFSYYDAGGNGTFMGMRGEYECDYWLRDGSDRVFENGRAKGTYELDLSPVQFYQMGRQVMEFCNKEFGTNYDTSFKKPDWVRPSFPDEQLDFSRKDKKGNFVEYLDMDFPVRFEKREHYDFSNGAKDWREAINYNKWEMKSKGVTYGEHRDSFYLKLAEGFNDYIKNAKELPKGMKSSYNLFLMKSTEEKFGLKPKYTFEDFKKVMCDRISDASARSFTEEQKKILKDFLYSGVFREDSALGWFAMAKPDFKNLHVPDEWIDDAREELLELMRGMDREEQSLGIKRF